jgi:hypothetical protein
MHPLEPAIPLLFILASTAIGQEAAPEGGDFPAIVWRLDHPGEAIPPRLVSAFGGVNVEGEDSAKWTRAEELDFYVGHAPGRNDLHIQRDTPWYAELWAGYWEERDSTVLIRRPCLSEEETFASLRTRLTRTLSARGGDHGLGISLGDEVGLTPWGGPLDLCVSEACRDAFGSFLRENSRWSGLIDKEQDGPTPYPDTEMTRAALIEGDARHVGAWLARRDFHHEVVNDFLARLASSARELSPGVSVGLFGLAGRTAFGGVGPEAILPHLDFIETYPVLDARELLYTNRRRGVRSFATIFREAGAPAGASWRLWEHWLRGGDGVILWSDRELAEYPEYLESMRRSVAAVRELRRKFPWWAPLPSGAAIIHDPDSLALSWLRDSLHDGKTWPKRFPSYHQEHGTREIALRACLRWLEDGGLLPGAVVFDSIGGELVERFPFLIASEVLVVEEPELDALSRYVEAGGRLLVHGRFASYDRRGEASHLESRAVLEKIAEDRVLELELDSSRYLAARELRKSSYARRRVEYLSDLTGAELQVEWKPRSAEAEVRWLVATQPIPGGKDELCAAIPNAHGAVQRARLRNLDVEITGVDGDRITWIHPSAARGNEVQLPAGEALIFRLSPR